MTSLFYENNFKVNKISKTFSQKLTHQTITGRFFHINIKNPIIPLKKYKAVSKNELKKLAFPKFIASYLQD
jgi:A/G-specific adenine glycosylase